MSESQEVKSPCISVCAMDDLSGLCLGCYRTLEEIEGWWDLKPEEQKVIVEAAEVRQKEQANFD